MSSMPKPLAYIPRAAGHRSAPRIAKRAVPETRGVPDTASLLAQLGAHAVARFNCRLAVLELAPAHAGIIEILAGSPGMSQCALARALGTLPSRMVGYVDELERKGLLERQPHKSDRRNNALHLTKAGRAAYRATSRLAQEHQQKLLAGLSRPQQIQLTELLSLVANQQGLISSQKAQREQPTEANFTARTAGAFARTASPAAGAAPLAAST
jgi:DNA-binding MarR family transcriptional regulator